MKNSLKDIFIQCKNLTDVETFGGGAGLLLKFEIKVNKIEHFYIEIGRYSSDHTHNCTLNKFYKKIISIYFKDLYITFNDKTIPYLNLTNATLLYTLKQFIKELPKRALLEI